MMIPTGKPQTASPPNSNEYQWNSLDLVLSLRLAVHNHPNDPNEVRACVSRLMNKPFRQADLDEGVLTTLHRLRNSRNIIGAISVVAELYVVAQYARDLRPEDPLYDAIAGA